jgi:predicted alpha/beta superfamily hydrolase
VTGRIAAALLLWLLAFLATPAAATAPSGYVLPGTEVHRIEAPALGRTYSLIVSLPPGYDANPERRYPVLYTTDTPQSLPLLRGVMNRIRGGGRVLEDAIIVGLGYSEDVDGTHSRRRDYTPSPNGDVDARPTAGRPVEYGEAEPYRLHIRDQVFPFIDSRYRIDPKRRIYAGHSYGGLFGTHVLLTEPTMFQRYVLMSPSLWYDRRLMLARERGYAARHKDMKADVYWLIGGLETVEAPDTEPFGDARHAMVEDMAAMVEALAARRYPSLTLRAETMPGEDHATLYTEGLTRALKWVLPGTGPAGEPRRCIDENGQPIPFCRWPDAWQPRPSPPADGARPIAGKR